MSLSITPWNFRSPNSESASGAARNPGRMPAPSGYAFVAMMIMVTVLLISMTAALPSIYQEGQREREEEAIFRAEQYDRAIYLFHRRFGRYPTSVKDLLKTDNMRFLREPYRDPLSPNGRWRFIHANAAGVLIDSWVQSTLTPSQVQPHATTLPSGQESVPTEQTEPKKPRKHPPSTCDGTLDSGSDSSGQTGTLLGAFIVGVAPCSDRQSIRVLDHRKHYDEWEFLALNYVEYGLPEPQATQSPQPGSPSNQPGMNNPSLFSQPGNNNPPGGNQNSGFSN